MRRQHTSAAWMLVWAALAALPAGAGLDRSIEKMMGREGRAAIEAEFRVVQTPVVAGFVDRVGQRVAAASPRQLTYTFRIIETDQVNAMALPSGDIYVTTGLLDFVESQDELAGVLAHEASHIAAKHSLRSFKKRFWTGVLFGAVKLPSGLQTVGDVASSLYFLRYSRKDEADADKLGAQIALEAGYDPFALQGFMLRLAEARKGRLSEVESWFTTHPEPERRASRLGERKELDPTRTTTAVTIGQGYMDRHFPSQAVLRLRRAETLAPEDPQVHLLLAQAAAAAGMTEEAASHAERAAALDPGLAEEARRIAQAPAAEPAPAGAASPGPADPGQRVADSLKQVETSREAAKAAAQALSDRLSSIATTRRELAERSEGLAGSLRDAERSGRLSSDRETMLRRSAGILKVIEDVVGRLGSVAKASSEGAKETQTAGEALAERLRAAASAAEKERLVRQADRYVADLDKRSAGNEEISREAEQALAAAGSAAGHLSTAIDAMSRQIGMGWGSDQLALESARTSLESAEADAKKASESAEQASALQSEAAARDTAWGLDMDTLALPPAQQTQLDAAVAGYLGDEAQAVRAAREEAGGLGSAMLKLIAQQAPASDSEATARPEDQAGVDLLLGLVRKDIKREVAAARRAAEDPEAEEPIPPEPADEKE